jgi:competence protein CoiA
VPLRCLDATTDGSIHAFDLSPDEWRAVALENRRARHLKMPCCSSPVTLKRSPRGTQFFAHSAVGNCSTAPETEAHLRLKRMAVEAARASAWVAATEVVGTTPSGEQWRADVLAQKGSRKVAIEIQWSGQTNDETLRRQERYAESGVRCLWLLRQSGFPITPDLPAARIGGNTKEGILALIPMGWREEQTLPIKEFLDAAFSRRLRFGVPVGFSATVSVRAGYIDCWKRSCGARTRIITGLDVAFGPNKCSFSVPDFDEYPDLFQVIRNYLPYDLGIGAIRQRYSNTQERAYLSNGCIRCDGLIGQFFEIHARYDEETICVFPIRISERWRAAIIKDGHEVGWAVYAPP